jgi:hypothetical protein
LYDVGVVLGLKQDIGYTLSPLLSPEDGSSMFLRNVDIDIRKYAAPEPETTQILGELFPRKGS